MSTNRILLKLPALVECDLKSQFRTTCLRPTQDYGAVARFCEQKIEVVTNYNLFGRSVKMPNACHV